MNIPSEAKLIAASIIEWCCCKEDRNEDENYPTHLVENLLKRQKQELIDKACEWYRKEHSYAVEEWLDQKCEELIKAMEADL